MTAWRRNIRRIGCAVVMTAVVAGIAGCGDAGDRLPLAGGVTWRGRPLEKGSIVLIPTAGHRGPKVGAEIVSGRYEIDEDRGPTPGTYRVEVRSDTGEHPHSPTDERPTKAPATIKDPIPQEYNRQSRLNVVISEERTTVNFELPINAPP